MMMVKDILAKTPVVMIMGTSKENKEWNIYPGVSLLGHLQQEKSPLMYFKCGIRNGCEVWSIETIEGMPVFLELLFIIVSSLDFENMAKGAEKTAGLHRLVREGGGENEENEEK